ncbi:DinB family protein [Dyadobacter sp. CY356]|uniref:DinB family protein n=1 Tax=Dyadobacter sp. CY356 TaxID=2906442 RepID=UPI001F18A517|nr:DinB family protein [Dyadobacter sp. CY356]MCF0055830.1 DinB family protein [Dyadobacter sp. CY356]
MQTNERKIIVSELISLIETGNAHVALDETIDNIPAEMRTVIPQNLPYSIWQLLEHIRITQWDIVEFCISADHKSPKWPEEYWPEKTDIVDDSKWKSTLQQIKNDRERFFDLLNNEKTDLYSPLPHGDGQNIFREALLIADHTSYHLGEILVMRRLLKCWKNS